MNSRVDRLWYGQGRPLWPLWPLAWLYRWVTARRRRRFLNRPGPRPGAPVVIVGNITAGGTGKSPLTAALVRMLRETGWQPVILTRGYGGKGGSGPLLVSAASRVAEAGDEPLMLARDSGCPVVVDRDRLRGACWALAQGLGDILLCDDGLQHYRLPRDLEIAVFDATRGIGNGAPIPVGPLREPVTRLQAVDFVISNGAPAAPLPAHPHCFQMRLEPRRLYNLATGEERGLDWLQGRRVRAIAGIGNPRRFFATLESLGAEVSGRGFPDHHGFTAADLGSAGEFSDRPLVMTAKDAVKARAFAHQGCWVLEVSARLPDAFRVALLSRLEAVRTERGGPDRRPHKDS